MLRFFDYLGFVSLVLTLCGMAPTATHGCVHDPYDATIRERCNQPHPDCKALYGPDSVMDCNLLCCNGSSERECWIMSPCGRCVPPIHVNPEAWRAYMDCAGECFGTHDRNEKGDCVDVLAGEWELPDCKAKYGPESDTDCTGRCCGGEGNDRLCWDINGCGVCVPMVEPYYWTAADGCRSCWGEPMVAKDGYCVVDRHYSTAWTIRTCRWLDALCLGWIRRETCDYVREHEPWTW